MKTEKQTVIDELKSRIAAFDDAAFGTAELMPEGEWRKPPFTPEKGVHPRLMVNASMIPALKDLLLGDAPEYAALRERFWADANAATDGVFPEKTVTESNGQRSVTHPFAYDINILASIEAKALAYLVTGDEQYGLEAILGMKNAILTLRYMYEGYEGMGGAVWTGGSHTMNVVSEAYDWCYDLLTDRDKEQIIGGMRTNVLSQIEFKYPPRNMGCVSGHGTGTQMFVEYMNVAAAFADERPDWWDFVAGRFYQEYIPVAEYMYSAGFVSQGTSYYAQNKYYGHIWSALMLTTLGDKSPLGDGMYSSPYKFLSHLMPNGNYFQTGDANWMKGQKAQGAEVLYNWVFVAAALTRDPVILAVAARSSDGCSKYNYDLAGGRMTPTVMAFCIANCLSVKSEEKPLDLIDYTAYPGGQTVIRSSWEEDSPAVLMRVGDLTMANHDHEDSGTFQIYYKGLLACESGFYTGVDYGKPHWKYYHHATVAHNCPLVWDPKSKHLEGDFGKYYTGGQRLHREAKSLEEWLSTGEYHVGRILGHGEGENYAYIGGDITGGYDKDEVESVKRDMLTVLGAGAPVMMLAYDDVTSVNPDAIKKFLLHTVNEPEISGKDITVKQGGGRLVMRALVGADKTEKIGGADKEFWVGKNADEGYNVSEGVWAEYFGSLWGRVELSSAGEKNNRMLVLMYATDADSDLTIEPTLIDNASAIGCVALDTVMAFARGERVVLDTDFEGEKRYVVAGLPYGEYRVTLGDTAMTLSVATDRVPSSGHKVLEADRLFGLEQLRSDEIKGSVSFTLGSGRVVIEKI